MNPDFSVILAGYRRIALAAAVVVVGIVTARIVVFFGLAGPTFVNALPGAGLLAALLLLAILGYGYR